jgi:hypothetical protein
MESRRGFFDIINTVLIYFVILVVVWGYAIGWYFNEIGARVEGPSEIYKEMEEVPGRLPAIPGAWDPAALLKVGQTFQYRVLMGKDVNLTYQILKETRVLFTVESSARIKTTASFKTKSSIMNLDIRDLLIQEKFSVDKSSGLPITSKYTTAFWNMEGCHPTRYYFLKGPLEEGASWEIPGYHVLVQVTGGKLVSGLYTYTCRITRANQSPTTMWVSKELPLLLGFDGENCLGRGKTVSRLVRYSPEPSKSLEIAPVKDTTTSTTAPFQEVARESKWH